MKLLAFLLLTLCPIYLYALNATFLAAIICMTYTIAIAGAMILIDSELENESLK